MSRTLPAGLVAVAAVCLLATAIVQGPGASGAAPDTTGPSVTIRAGLLVGGQLNVSTDDQEPQDCTHYTWVPYRISVTATDPSGIRDYNMWDVTSAGPPRFMGWWSDGAAGTGGDLESPNFTGTFSDYDGDCGGGALETDAYAVTAYDKAGNARYVATGDFPTVVVQENGDSPSSNQPHGVTIAYNGSWRTSTCVCASWGRQASTTQLGATATIRVPSGTDKVGLVMAKGPGRGQADILVDGVRVTTIDTRAATNTNRIIVWKRPLTTATSHVIKVRNLATAGRTRIDLDAVLL